MFEIVKRKHPTWCVFENVYGHIAMGLDQVLHDMESEGYTTQTFVVPACSLNAPHKRDRLWIVGNSEHDGSLASKIRRGNQETSRGASQGQNQAEQSSRTSRRKDNGTFTDTESEGLQGLDKRSPTISTERDEITDIGTKSSGDKNVSNTHDPRDRTSKYETNQDGQTIEQRREVISQSESSRYSQDVLTPNAWDGNRGPRSEKNLQEKNHMVNLITAVQTDQRKNEQEVGGTLNPMWVEWLMGYPPGWTDLED